MFIELALKQPDQYAIWIMIVMFSICIHEYSHARAALYFGDDTALQNGYLTLNPLKTMGPFSLIMLFLIGIAWGAVPVNPSTYKKKLHRSLTSFAGPASNLALALIFAIVAAVLMTVDWESGHEISATAYEVSVRFVMLNFVLFLLNMLPVPMLDGWHIAEPFFPQMKSISSQTGELLTVGFLLLFFVTGYGSKILFGLSSHLSFWLIGTLTTLIEVVF